MDHRNLNDLRVVDLKKELELRGLSKSGSKKELIDRLKAQMAIEQLRGSSFTNEGDAPSLQVAGDEENEFVKNYLQQRQKLLSQQMEQKKKFEEEASMSQSECELDESNVSESQNAHSSVVNQSDDDTDVESIPETSTKQDNAPVNQISSNAETSPLDQIDVAISSRAHSDLGNDNGISLESTRNAHETSFSSPRRQSRSRSRSQSSHEAPVESPSHHSDRSLSRSRTNSESRYRSRSNSSSSRSSSQEKSVERSRSPSEERKTEKADTRLVERKKSLSESSEKSRSPSVKNITVETSSVETVKSTSPSVTKLPVSETFSIERERSDSPSETVLDACNVEQVGVGDNESEVNTSVIKPTELGTEDAEIIKSESVKLDWSSSEFKDAQQEDNKKSQSQSAVDSKGHSENVSTSEMSSESTKPARKRRWGSASVQAVKPSINISTDSLKGLIPEVDPGSLSMETVMEFEEAVVDSLKKDSDLETDAHTALKTDDDSTENGDTRAAKMRRTVYQESTKGDTNKSDDIESSEAVEKTEEVSVANSIRLVKAPVTAPVAEVSNKIDEASRQVRLSRTVSLVVEDPVDVGRKSPSPSRHPPSNVVHVTGLVRPYTIGQLKELLGRTGTLQPDGFWIDNIKSHCYVVYATVEEGVATRKALHGKRWPATNPKLLGVDFRTMDEFEKRKNNIVVRENPTAAPVSADRPGNQLQPIENKRDQDRARSGNESLKDMKKSPRDAAKPPIKENKDKTGGVVPVREWDRNKLRQSRSLSQEKRRKDDKAKTEARDKRETSRHDQQKSRDDRRGRSRLDKSESGAKVEEEPPAKLLDDLFRKTVAMPCIYWLPLTDEQANEKIAQEKQERLLRDQMREQRRIEREQQAEVDRQQRLKAQEDRVRPDHSRDRQPAQRRKFSEADDSSRRRGRSRSGGRANRR